MTARRVVESSEWLYYVAGDETEIMTSAYGRRLRLRCSSCCLRQCRFRRVSAAAGRPDRPTDRILAARCQSARVYRSTPVRPLIAASSAADAAAAAAAAAAAVAAGTTRPGA